ncbi:RnfABCDGE type electron transport complex subunit B [Acidobacteriota bacterium]
MNFLIPIITMATLGFLFAFGLVLAYNKLKVEEDPKIEEISEVLPQANCGACGYSGCRAFAEAVVNGKTAPNSCPVGGEDVANQIAAVLGVTAEKVIKQLVRIHCRGFLDAAPASGTYLGISTCQAAHLIGGNKQCSYGCLGFGDCALSCPFDALFMGQDGLPIVREDKCTACGICVDTCPRNILALHPVVQNTFVYCCSLDRGPTARKVCKNSCIACGICVRACPEAIILENNLAIITDYKKIEPDQIQAIEKCPTDAIGRLKKGNEG